MRRYLLQVRLKRILKSPMAHINTGKTDRTNLIGIKLNCQTFQSTNFKLTLQRLLHSGRANTLGTKTSEVVHSIPPPPSSTGLVSSSFLLPHLKMNWYLPQNLYGLRDKKTQYVWRLGTKHVCTELNLKKA